jgi:NAD(P)-dependent dehydrogenase (short-subunit alcohol dehydrogenase family)
MSLASCMHELLCQSLIVYQSSSAVRASDLERMERKENLCRGCGDWSRAPAAEFHLLADVPPEVEWFDNLTNRHTRRVYQNAISLTSCASGYYALPYSAAKAALLHATRWVANELGPYCIRVNSISPGGIVTGAFAKGGGASEEDAAKTVGGLAEFFATIQPIPRAGIPDDVANAAIFLASDLSGFVTGHDIVIDGGMGMGNDWPTYVALRTEIGKRVTV